MVLKINNFVEAQVTSVYPSVVSFKCIVKGHQDCRFDVKEGEDFKVLKKISEKGRALQYYCKQAWTIIIRSPHRPPKLRM